VPFAASKLLVRWLSRDVNVALVVLRALCEHFRTHVTLESSYHFLFVMREVLDRPRKQVEHSLAVPSVAPSSNLDDQDTDADAIEDSKISDPDAVSHVLFAELVHQLLCSSAPSTQDDVLSSIWKCMQESATSSGSAVSAAHSVNRDLAARELLWFMKWFTELLADEDCDGVKPAVKLAWGIALLRVHLPQVV